MKFLHNTRFTGPALLLLLLLNTVLLVLFLKGPPPPPPHGHAGPRDFLVRELNMDKAQQDKYDVLIGQHRAQVDALQNDIREYREAMAEEYSTPASTIFDSLSREIGKMQAGIERATFLHFRDVRTICTPDQQPKFDSLVVEALRMMGPPPPPPHGPRPH